MAGSFSTLRLSPLVLPSPSIPACSRPVQAPAEPIALTWWRHRNFRPAERWPPTTSDEEQTTLRSLASRLTFQEARDQARVISERSVATPVSYTHLTLPTKRIV